ncbi:hypothetical protein [Pseudoxanthomonas winnipegensis]|uniref:Uncharacterized protein n=1 Tax=Pseudoxanthomonas winnipegensis TaxID=2480810 RepID=A0A4Q8LYY3_9GAMM|nr:hypothetical protein [Pseudoxanthomonas winnipegensis]RZZ90635.1 hypothetical protein EA663_02455 [Pseudoxanthomonas winnipegensis]TAA37210.1 hypothetical protein EA656_00585 [Pseudoxanthomonas winnipegensis]
MSAFFVGQRVKKVRGMVTGLTGVIAEFDHSDSRSVGITSDIAGVGINARGEPVRFSPGRVVWCRASELEPIVPEGHKPGSFATHRELMDSLEGAPA